MAHEAKKTFQQIHDGETGTANSASIGVVGDTVGHVQVDDAGSGDFTVVVVGQVLPEAEEQTLYSESGAGVKAASIEAEGIYFVNVAGLSRIKVNITDNTGGTAVSVYLGLNS